MDDGPPYSMTFGNGAVPKATGETNREDCRCVEHQSLGVSKWRSASRRPSRLPRPGRGYNHGRCPATACVPAGADRGSGPFTLRCWRGFGRRGIKPIRRRLVFVFITRGLGFKKNGAARGARRAPAWRESVRGGRPIRGGSTPSRLGSSPRPGSKPTWPSSGGGGSEASRPTYTGECPLPSSPALRHDLIDAPPLGLEDLLNANFLLSTSSRFLPRRSRRATSVVFCTPRQSKARAARAAGSGPGPHSCSSCRPKPRLNPSNSVANSRERGSTKHLMRSPSPEYVEATWMGRTKHQPLQPSNAQLLATSGITVPFRSRALVSPPRCLCPRAPHGGRRISLLSCVKSHGPCSILVIGRAALGRAGRVVVRLFLLRCGRAQARLPVAVRHSA